MIIKLIKRNFAEKIIRKSFKNIENKDIQYFSSILDNHSIETENLDFYNTDWMRKYKGNSKLVLKSKTTEDVSQILKYCQDQNLAIVPQGGNTGLVGGSVPVFDEIILNLSKMNRIIHYDLEEATIYCEAGCILQNLNDYLKQYKRVMPLDLGAKGSCMIGGNISTNAGGIHFIKHGSFRNNVKSMRVVLPDGKILFFKEDNQDVKQIFIGAEGTLGVITESKIKTAKLDDYISLSIIGLNSFEKVIELYLKAKSYFKDNLSAIEFFDSESMKLVTKYLNYKPLFEDNPTKYKFYLLIQNSSTKENCFEILSEYLIKENLEEDCIITDDPNKMKELWTYRENISSACGKRGIVFKYDVSLHLTHFYSIVEDIRRKVSDLAVTIGYGHVGDFNLHLNVSYDKYDQDQGYHTLENILEPYLFDYLNQINGSISAEHGVGIAKSAYLNRSQSENNINLMKIIKKAIDVKGIMNPYKIFH